MGHLILEAFEILPGDFSDFLCPFSFVLPPSLPVWISFASTYLVRVNRHASGEPHHGDAVEACGVGDRCRSQVVIGLGRVTHQDGVDLKGRTQHFALRLQNESWRANFQNEQESAFETE